MFSNVCRNVIVAVEIRNRREITAIGAEGGGVARNLSKGSSFLETRYLSTSDRPSARQSLPTRRFFASSKGRSCYTQQIFWFLTNLRSPKSKGQPASQQHTTNTQTPTLPPSRWFACRADSPLVVPFPQRQPLWPCLGLSFFYPLSTFSLFLHDPPFCERPKAQHKSSRPEPSSPALALLQSWRDPLNRATLLPTTMSLMVSVHIFSLEFRKGREGEREPNKEGTSGP